MATQKFGPLGPFSGKLGKVIGYIDQFGIQQLRTVGDYVIQNPSDRIKASWDRTKITVNFLKPITELIRMGFGLEAKSKRMNAYNLATSYTKKAIAGKYPDLYIDYSKVFFSAGTMPVVKNAEVIELEDGLMFEWENQNLEAGMQKSDLAMLLAYLPESGKAYYLRSGARRRQGYEHLILPFRPAGQVIETYIAFNAEDHKTISNSVYTGQIKFGNDR